MSNSNKPNWSLARDTITFRPRSQRGSVAVTDSDRNLQKTDLLRARKDSGERPAARYFARRSIAETKTDSKTFCLAIGSWPKVPDNSILSVSGEKSSLHLFAKMALPDCLLPPAEIRRNLSLSSLALRNRRPEMLKMLAKGSMSNLIMGELVPVYHNLTDGAGSTVGGRAEAARACGADHVALSVAAATGIGVHGTNHRGPPAPGGSLEFVDHDRGRAVANGAYNVAGRDLSARRGALAVPVEMNFPQLDQANGRRFGDRAKTETAARMSFA